MKVANQLEPKDSAFRVVGQRQAFLLNDLNDGLALFVKRLFNSRLVLRHHFLKLLKPLKVLNVAHCNQTKSFRFDKVLEGNTKKVALFIAEVRGFLIQHFI